MFFKEHFKSIADCIDAKYNGMQYEGMNPADKGEICEIFIQEFLTETLGDAFKIFRGGKIVDFKKNFSKQLDVLLCGKKTIKLFGDKGLFPTEIVFGVFSITSTLSKNKLIDCVDEFLSIPKENYDLSLPGYLPHTYVLQTENIWKNLIPFKCVFAYKGTIKESFTTDLIAYSEEKKISPFSLPDVILVNKVGAIEKKIEREDSGRLIFEYKFVDFKKYDNYGYIYSVILFHLFNLAHEESIIRPKYERYFNQDI